MIGYLKGKILSLSADTALILTGGVGYEVLCSSSAAAELTGKEEGELYTYLQAREDGISLYGFVSPAEKNMFLKLVSVSGVGPKLALSVLSTFSPAQLAQIVTAQDASRMAQVPGVGRKKASRLLVELSDVFSKNAELRGLVGLSEPDGAPLPLAVGAGAGVEAEATEALLSMGFTGQEAELALEGHAEAGAVTIEQVLAYALRRLGSGR